MNEAFRRLPRVDRLLEDPALSGTVAEYSRQVVLEVVRGVLEEARAGIADGKTPPGLERLIEEVRLGAAARYRVPLRPVINATGVLIHTNLGRAPLSSAALAAVQEASAGYSNLELDLASGERGSRHVLMERFVCELTGAEAAMAVNNNAAAVYLALTALARGKEVVVSRGEAVEIGGGFRIPDVLKQSGATLVEVGTTNRTYIQDFEQAVNDHTGALLRVHTSNFKVSGFVHSPTLEEMAAAAGKAALPLLHDIGSGCLLDTRPFGLAPEPMPQESIRAGADLVFFSGDKLLGGPQAGIIAGKAHWVELLKRHPMARALRLDKMTLAALAATLLHYIKGEALSQVPVWRMVSTTTVDLDRRARRWARTLPGAQVVDTRATIGGGSLPGEELPSRALSIEGSGERLEAAARRLRTGSPAVVARIEGGQLLCDARTVLPDQDRALVGALKGAFA